MRPGTVKQSVVVASALMLAACRGGGPPRAPVMGEAFVGPATLNLRKDIPLDSPTVAALKHGDRVQILVQRRTTFLKVRAPSGAEGWTEARQLLAAEDMAGLKTLAQRAAGMPSQGRATTDTDLRVRIQPATSAPSFLLLKENDKVDVLAHVRRPRTALPRKPLVKPAPKKARATKPGKIPQYPPPPLPLPPKPPENWLDLSKTEEPEEPPDEAPGPPQPTDDWCLVRAADGETGWVLTRRLRMAIPDDVGQYAEGHPIVSYFSLGSVQDGDQRKDTWLWTTVASGAHPYDFDSFRVFAWSIRRHRYETGYIQRNLIGYSPVLLEPVRYSANKGRNGDEYSGFSVCLQKKDGQLYREQFAVLGNTVRFAGEAPCQLPPPVNFSDPGSVLPPPKTAPNSSPESFAARVKRRIKAIFGR